MDVPELKQWLQRRDNYLSPDIQNDIIEMMAHNVQRKVVLQINAFPWFAVIVDGTIDVGSLKQLSICARHVNNNTLESEEKFLGLYNANDCRAETITAVTSHVLVRLNLPLQNLRGHCFDCDKSHGGSETGLISLTVVAPYIPHYVTENARPVIILNDSVLRFGDPKMATLYVVVTFFEGTFSQFLG